MHWKQLTAISIIMIALAGCSLANKLVHRIDINQGNFIDPIAVEELKFGMTKEQVKYLLGQPMLIEVGFPNIWYFVQWLKPGHSKAKQKELVLTFDDKGVLTGMTGDFQPGVQFFETIH